MKARIKKTDIVVNVEINDHLDEYIYQVPVGKGKFLLYKEDDLDFEDLYDWRTFRAEAAKNILCGIISNEGVADERNVDNFTKDNQVKDAVLYADELIRQLKEKEGK